MSKSIPFIKTMGTKLSNVESKVQGTIAEKWIIYWKGVIRDYKDVVVDVKNELITKPSKTLIMGITTGLVYHFATTNPDATHFRDTFLKHSNDLLLITPDSRKPECVKHLRYIERCYNNHVIRYLNLGLLSIVWEDNYSDISKTFESECSYLQYQYKSWPSRILDIGFLDNWWALAKITTDYDINY